ELLGSTGGTLVSMGTKVSSRMLEKYKGAADTIDRVAFLVSTPIVIKFHYFEDIGYMQCFNGDCCEYDSQPAKIRYLFPIIKYHSNQKGACTADCGYEVMVFSASQDMYASMITLHETSIEDGGEGISQYDYKIQCTDVQYQKLTLSATQKSIWKDRQDIADDLKDRWDVIVKNISKAIAKSVSPKNFAELMSDAAIEEDDDIAEAVITDTAKFYEED
ncbi:MAG: hypothetical protein ACRC0R_00105, partial [Cetobacterium sp.]